MCEGLSLRQMNDQADTYADCMLHFGNRPNLPDGMPGNSTPSPQNRNPQIMAGPNPPVPPGPPRPVITPPVSSPRSGEKWLCRPNGMELSIDRGAKVIEVVLPFAACHLVITNGAVGPVGGNCPFFSGNPLMIYHQFVNFVGSSVEFGYEARGEGAAHLALWTLPTQNIPSRGMGITMLLAVEGTKRMVHARGGRRPEVA